MFQALIKKYSGKYLVCYSIYFVYLILLVLIGNMVPAMNSVANSNDCVRPSSVPIHQIQGNGQHSPLVGQRVETHGIVSHLDWTGEERSGFFLQVPMSLEDNDSQTSEAVYVYSNALLKVGDWVSLEGLVKEYHDKTEMVDISNLKLCQENQTEQLNIVSLEEVVGQDKESLEGMLVHTSTGTVTNNYYLGLYGQWQFKSKLNWTVDDGVWKKWPTKWYLFDPSRVVIGQTVRYLQGVVDYRFDQYRILPNQPVKFDHPLLSNANRKQHSSSTRLASFNVKNFFNGHPHWDNERGAKNQQDFNRQRKALVEAISRLDADLIGLAEIENDSNCSQFICKGASILSLLELLNKEKLLYRAIQVPSMQSEDAITQGLIYKADRFPSIRNVEFLHYPVQEFTHRGKRQKIQPRPGLAVSLEASDGGVLNVLVNHWPSKGNKCLENLKGNETISCVHLKQKMAEKVRAFTEGSGWVLMGDFNSHPDEPAMKFLNQFWRNGHAHLAASERQYTYRYKGQKSQLDYIWLPSGYHQLQGDIWHINSDWPPLFDPVIHPYWNPNRIDAPKPYLRSSDHDPIWVDLEAKSTSKSTQIKPL